MRRLFAVSVMCSSLAQAADTFTVPAEFWDRPRTGRAVLDQTGVKQAVAAYQAQPGSQIIVHHGYGAESVAQAEELRNWLMALAIDSSRIRLAGDAGTAQAVKLEI